MVCRRCRHPLAPPYKFCSACGANQSGQSQIWIILAIIGGGFLALLVIVGILAAIAIPNFLRYQLRAKAADVRLNLETLARAEEAYYAKEQPGRYVALPHPVPAAGALSGKKMPWSADEVALVNRFDWIILENSTYARYHVVVAGGDETHGAALSACAVTDLDEDGQVAATVVWIPAYGPDQSIAVMPPDAPCTDTPLLAPEASLRFRPGRDQPNVPVVVSPPDVF